MSVDDLSLALELADIADAITLPRFRDRDLQVQTKADATWVTESDTATEAAVRARLASARPGHAVLGEEEGLLGDPSSPWRWIIDPIDGTSSYVRGLPIWGTLIALAHGDEIVLGVASAPALARRWWASRGGGAWVNGSRIQVSEVDSLDRCHLGHASIASWAEHGRGSQFGALAARVWRTRGVGDFWMHVLVAEGVFDAACEPIVNLWDLAALQVIVEEAGGRFTDLDGHARPDGGNVVSSNGRVHDAVLGVLAKS